MFTNVHHRPRQNDFLFGGQSSMVIKSGKLQAGWRVSEGAASEIKFALLERHETGGCEKSAPEHKVASVSRRWCGLRVSLTWHS